MYRAMFFHTISLFAENKHEKQTNAAIVNSEAMSLAPFPADLKCVSQLHVGVCRYRRINRYYYCSSVLAGNGTFLEVLKDL